MLGIEGYVNIKVYDTFGNLKYEDSGHNVTTYATNASASVLGGSKFLNDCTPNSGVDISFRNVQFYNGTTLLFTHTFDATGGDTLTSETDTSSGYTELYVVHTSDNSYTIDTLYLVAYFDGTDSNGDATTCTIIFSTYTLSSSLSVSDGDKIEVTWDVHYTPSTS